MLRLVLVAAFLTSTLMPLGGRPPAKLRVQDAELGGAAKESCGRAVVLLDDVLADLRGGDDEALRGELVDRLGLVADQLADVGAPGEAWGRQVHDDASRLRGGADLGAVEPALMNLRAQIATAARLPQGPAREPDPARGEALYQALCSTCHATAGAAHAHLAPTPPDFHAPDAEPIGRARAYLTVSYGLVGTPMPSFLSLPEADRWALAEAIAHASSTSKASPRN